MPLPENWLTKLTKSAVRQPRTHMLWVHHRDTPADTLRKRARAWLAEVNSDHVRKNSLARRRVPSFWICFIACGNRVDFHPV